MPVKPTLPKHRVEDLGNKLVILIPSARSWYLASYLGFFAVLCAVSDVFLLANLIFSPAELGEPILFFVIMVIVFTAFGGVLVYLLAWQVIGKEVVEINAQNIIISRVVPGLRFPQEFSAEHIKDLRISSSNVNLLSPAFLFYFGFYPGRHYMGTLAFDYGAKTFRFGSGIDEAEAKQIVAEIQEKYPQYCINSKGG